MVKQDIVIGIVAVLVVMTLSALVIIMSVEQTSIQKENDVHLMEIVSTNNQLVDVCNWDVPRGIAVELCDKQLKRVWDNFCQDNEENLNSCSRVETYLQSRDLL
ncbi:MAG: hypothetical protein P0116_00755 [Candidatus Nitrosocosmicus sp.]|nr:hypothetical protein [Candidatus Nitrosocosmicus sp.]